jgi:hypothetical protein
MNCASRSFALLRLTLSNSSRAEVLIAQGISLSPSIMENWITIRSNS